VNNLVSAIGSVFSEWTTMWPVFFVLVALGQLGLIVLRRLGQQAFFLTNIGLLVAVSTVWVVAVDPRRDYLWTATAVALVTAISLLILSLPVFIASRTGFAGRAYVLAAVSLVSSGIVWMALPFYGLSLACSIAKQCT
jgi:hypothetical protein